MDRRWRIAGTILLLGACGGQHALFPMLRTGADPGGLGSAGLPAAAAAVLSAAAFIAGGFLQDRKGPFPVVAAGAALFTAGWLLASAGGRAAVPAGMLLGSGAGLGTAVSVPVLAKWYPERRGLAIGLTSLSGAAPLILGPVLHGIFSAVGWGAAVVITGVPVAAAAAAGAALMRDPPPGWQPPGGDRPAVVAVTVPEGGWTAGAVFRLNAFRLLWAVYFLGILSGLMIIGRAVPLGERAGLDKAVAAGGLGVMALVNGCGRIVFGALSDRAGRMRTAAIMNGVYLAAFLLVLPWAGTFMKWLLGISLVAFSYGAFSAVIPAAAADFFGTRHLGAIYVLLQMAHVGASLTARSVEAATASRVAELLAVSVPAAAGLAICLLLKPPPAGGGAGSPGAGGAGIHRPGAGGNSREESAG